ncbi:MAG: class I tRNA ligase family protein [Aliidongia sp.]
MVCHETYKDADGTWLYPEETVTQEDGSIVDRQGRPVTHGRTEKMSKSKKNTVGLDAICGTYGADTARLFLLSDSPPERDLEWTAAGIEGSWRYVNRLYRLIDDHRDRLALIGTRSTGDGATRRLTHKTIAAVTEDLDNFRFKPRRRPAARVVEPSGRGRGHGPSRPNYASRWKPWSGCWHR